MDNGKRLFRWLPVDQVGAEPLAPRLQINALLTVRAGGWRFTTFARGFQNVFTSALCMAFDAPVCGNRGESAIVIELRTCSALSAA